MTCYIISELGNVCRAMPSMTYYILNKLGDIRRAML